MEYKKDIYSLCKSEEEAYKTPIPVIDGYSWNMYEHIRLTTLYKNSQLSSGKNDDKPVKNIILPFLRLQYRTEGFDVKDVQIYANSAKDFHKSFLIRKYHERWARENGVDTFIDDIVESYVDFGGALVKNVNGPCPEVVPLQTVAFCDQTDLLSGTIGIKHNYAPDELLEFSKKGWGKFGTSLEEVIRLAEHAKAGTQTNGTKAQTPGKYIEVYEIHGIFPDAWLENGEGYEDDKTKYSRQVHIITHYQGENNDRRGVCLFRGKLNESPFKAIIRDKIYGRALGMGGAEELFDAQVWTTYDQIRIKGMLDQASKIIYQTTDASFAARNKTDNLENGDILVTEVNTAISQINTQPTNVVAFESNVAKWDEHARLLSGATEAIMGESPVSGTPFKLQDLVVREGHSLHDYRRGKLATFLDEIYRDWIIPHIVKEVTKGQTFLTELDMSEMQSVADSVVNCAAYEKAIEMIFAGQEINMEEIEFMKQMVREGFMKAGNKKFIEIVKEDFKDAPLEVVTNIAGKQKNLAQIVDKLTNVFRQVLAVPQVLDDPRMADLFNQILESSGLEPIDTFPRNKAPQPSAGVSGMPGAPGQPGTPGIPGTAGTPGMQLPSVTPQYG